MTEQELKDLELKLKKREEAIDKSEKGLKNKIAVVLDREKNVKSQAKLLEILNTSGIKNTKDLSDFLDNTKQKTEPTSIKEEPKEGDMDKKELQDILGKFKEDMQKDFKEVLSKVEQTSHHVEAESLGKTLEATIKKIGKDVPLIANYWKNSKEEVIQSFVQSDSTNDPEKFLKTTNANLEILHKNIQAPGSEPAKDVKAETKPAEEKVPDLSNITLDKVSTSSTDSKEADNKKVAYDKMTPEQQLASNINKAIEMTEAQQNKDG